MQIINSHCVTSWLKSSSPRHSIHAWSSVRCVVVVLFTRLLFLSVPLLFFQTFQTPSSAFHKKFMSKDLRDFRLGTVASNDHEDATCDVTRHWLKCLCASSHPSVVNTHPHTSHFSHWHALISMSHVTLVHGSSRCHPHVVVVLILFDLLLSVLSIVSLISFFHSLVLHLHLPCGLVRREVPCALPRMRS